MTAATPTSPERPAATVAHVTLAVEGMTCAACSARVQRVLEQTAGVERASVNLMTNAAAVQFNPALLSSDDLAQRVRAAGYGASPVEAHPDDLGAASLAVHERVLDAERRTLAYKAAASSAAGVVLMLAMMAGSAPWTRWLGLALTLPTLGWAGRHFFVRALAAARHRAADMNTLVALGTGAAFVYSVGVTLLAEQIVARGMQVHVYYEAAVWIVAFVLLGNLLEARAKHGATSAIRRLIGLRPHEARLLRGDADTLVPIGQVRPGDLLRVKPGDRIAADGFVVEGHSTVDESMLTGEPMPAVKQSGAALSAGTVNMGGALVMRALRTGRDTTLARIVSLVQSAQESRAPIQQLADRVAGIFVPVVLVIAVLTFAAWAWLGPAPSLLHALVAAVSVLVIACPCAMGLAVPTAVMAATGRAAEFGLLIKGGDALQRAHAVDTVVFDKTGTLTVGRPRVIAIHRAADAEWSVSQLLALTAALERASEHPLAAAIVAAAAADGAARLTAEQIENVPGRGIRGRVGDADVQIGSAPMLGLLPGFEALSARAAEEASLGRTVVHVGIDGRYAGLMAIGDTPREEAAACVRALHDDGLRVVMLTGDGAATARAIALQLGIRDVVAEATPETKLASIAALRAEGRVVAMVGDGINDAPALAEADVGIALGTGTDVALETAPIALMRSDLRGVRTAIALSRQTLRVIRQNLAWAFGYNIVGIPIAAGVLYPLWGVQLSPALAAAAMALSSVSVVTNSLRLRRFGRIDT